ncbi:hypothetical protein OG884_15595 [Streptosporangium sp. NBC_01755]|uniref:hypothetical protein n=1 Tax=Streptosporangium sp. NBC_01755 TaxID=2975949 RepID=UPI002DD89A9D|nr:hypothetical protein [Streptosporangium sp. NBC_01755]WSD03258.1 hypothetical protein OG884_15595 [Streptosporangium sp. NBC_01755]
MTPEAAAWVRTAVLEPLSIPTPSPRCACQLGTYVTCHRGDHQACPVVDAGIWGRLGEVETLIYRPGGQPAQAREALYRREMSPRSNHVALVWLADRRCRWRCLCGCHEETHTPEASAGLEVVALPGFEDFGRTAVPR